MMSWWQYTLPDGRRVCYNKEPTFVCPYRMKAEDAPEYARRAFAFVADQLGMDLDKVMRMVLRPSHHGGRMRVNGKLTDRCDYCGAKMERLGFRCWIDRLARSDEAKGPTAQLNIAIHGKYYVTERSFFADTKQKASRWARREYEQATAKEGSDR